MRSFRRGAIAATLLGILAGCGGAENETVMPTTAPTNPPEAAQMKKEMEKRLKMPVKRTSVKSQH